MLEETDERILLARERTELSKERSRLANERTFLAWIRTGLASVGGGLAIAHFLTFHDATHQILAEVVGCILVILGIVIFGLSFFDYRSSYQKLHVKGVYAGSVGVISAISFTLIAISLVLLAIVFKILG